MKKTPLFILIFLLLTSCTLSNKYPAPLGSTKITCPWNCGGTVYYAIPQLCTEADVFVSDIRADMKSQGYGNDSVYNTNSNVAFDGLWNWERYKITTGMGWTGWWVALSNYCIANNYWESSNASSIHYGETKALTFSMKQEGDKKHIGKLLKKTKNSITMSGNAESVYTKKTITSPNFNSPYIYLENAPKELDLKITTALNAFQNMSPDFNEKNGWSVSNQNGVLSVEGEILDQLFYEVALNKVFLNRNGRNFTTKEELENYLQESDFLSKLGLNEIQAKNSLDYVLPKIAGMQATNYYLTILSDESIQMISNLAIKPVPENIIRSFFAVYPTDLPIKTNGEFVYPKEVSGDGFTLKEFGEVLVDEDMFVIWEN